MSLLKVVDLNISFDTLRGKLSAVRHLSFEVNAGETLGVVGESGCGKSITNLALLDLLAPNAIVQAKELNFDGVNLLKASEKEKSLIRGSSMTMIFQDPMTSLNPSFTVGFQLLETLELYSPDTKENLFEKAVMLLDEVGIPDPESRMETYPHELSGGMAQRVMIAQALACNPRLLICDEPTTALDVTIQSQILDLLKKIQRQHNMAMIFVTHDIAVVANMSDRIQVMYAGEIVESGKTDDVIQHPSHPYTEALFKSLPGYIDSKDEKLYSLPGMVPDLVHRPKGCQLGPRCPYVKEECGEMHPPLEQRDKIKVKCFYPLGETHG